jgi:hypothetical protein
MSQSRRPPREDDHVCRRAATDGVGEVLRQHVPLPTRGLGEDVVRQAYDIDEDDDRKVMRLPKHLRKLLSSIDETDVSKLQALMNLDPKTVAWIAEKNPRELKSLDGAVEFVTSSRTAAKVLAWCFVTAATAFGLVVTAAKNGIDLFQIVRGGKG